MAGGNQSTSKRGYRNLKGGGQKAPDVRSLSGAELLGDENNTQLFDGNGLAEPIDTEFGLSMTKETPNAGGYKGQANGYLVEAADIEGGVPARTSKPKNASAFPGGGWD